MNLRQRRIWRKKQRNNQVKRKLGTSTAVVLDDGDGTTLTAHKKVRLGGDDDTLDHTAKTEQSFPCQLPKLIGTRQTPPSEVDGNQTNTTFRR